MGYLHALQRWIAPGLLEHSNEHLISICRLVLAAVSLAAIYLDPTQPARFAGAAYSLLAGYLAFAAGLAVFTARRQLAPVGMVWCYAADIAVAVVLMLFTEGPTSPFFAFFTFILISATLRWKWRGALGTAAVLIAAFIVLAAFIPLVPSMADEESELGRTIIRLAYFTVAAAMLAYLGAYLERGRERIIRLARWPVGSGGLSESHALEAILSHAASVARAPRIVVVWERAGEEHRHFTVHQAGRSTKHLSEPRNRFNGLVAAELLDLAFATKDAAAGPVQVLHGRDRRIPDAIDPDLREAFAIRSVASAPLKGEICRGRVFLLDRAQWTQDHLALAEAIGSRLGIDLDHLTLRQRWERDAALRERLRLARDVHDGVLQGLTAANLQLKLGLRKADPAARDVIGTVQEILTGEQRRLRDFVDSSRGRRNGISAEEAVGLAEFRPLVREAGRQWGCATSLAVVPPEVTISAPMAAEIAFFLSEAIANAARHGRARSVEVELEVRDGAVAARISDDGCGITGLRGTFTHGDLRNQAAGPRSICERAAILGGEVGLQSSCRGTTVAITLPQVATQ